MIFVNSIFLALDDPQKDPNGLLASVLIGAEPVFTALFSLELVVKVNFPPSFFLPLPTFLFYHSRIL